MGIDGGLFTRRRGLGRIHGAFLSPCEKRPRWWGILYKAYKHHPYFLYTSMQGRCLRETDICLPLTPSPEKDSEMAKYNIPVSSLFLRLSFLRYNINHEPFP